MTTRDKEPQLGKVQGCEGCDTADHRCLHVSPAAMATGGRALHFLIYLELANTHRNTLMLALARTLNSGGHKVSVACEPVIALRLSHNHPVEVHNNSHRIEASFCLERSLDIHICDTFCGESTNDLSRANDLRRQLLIKLLSTLEPDYVVIWNGNFEYQQGTIAALREATFENRVLHAEVAWFPQSEFLYLDLKGVNAFSSIPAEDLPPLLPHQKVQLSAWQDRYRVHRFGDNPPPVVPRRIFVPMQVDTDTSISRSSSFKSMKEFIRFLEDWIPQDYEVLLKLHPKATYNYVPSSNRPNFRIIVSGSIDEMIATAEAVVGINSTVLIESAALGKRVISFGDSLFSGTGAILQAARESDARAILSKSVSVEALESFLYYLVYERQISIRQLEQRNFSHLASRAPFNSMPHFERRRHESATFVRNSQEGKSMIRIGKSKVARTACLDVEKGGQIIIGDDCEIRHHAVLEVSGRYSGSIEIGNHCVIGIGNWMQGSGRIKVGNDVIIGPYVAIVSTNHSYEDMSLPVAQQPLQTGEVVIEDDVWIGAHCTIAQNVRIGAHSIIGANSFVNKDVPPYSIVAGAPARIIRARQ